jgi:hypothetical protein
LIEKLTADTSIDGVSTGRRSIDQQRKQQQQDRSYHLQQQKQQQKQELDWSVAIRDRSIDSSSEK